MYIDVIIAAIAVVFVIVFILVYKKRKYEKTKFLVQVWDGRERYLVPCNYTGKTISAKIDRGDSKEQYAWFVGDLKPSTYLISKEFKYNRIPVFEAVIGELYIRQVDLAEIPETFKETLRKTKNMSPDDLVKKTKEIAELSAFLGVDIQPGDVIKNIITPENTIDGTEMFKIIDGSIRNALIDPIDDTIPMALGGILGFLWSYMVIKSLPTKYLDDPLINTVLMVFSMTVVIFVFRRRLQMGGG